MKSRSLLGSRSFLSIAVAAALTIPLSPATASSRSASDHGNQPNAVASLADTAGIPVVTELVQARPKTEGQAQAWSDALVFAEENPADVGYPYIDPTTGNLELSAVSERGTDLLEQERSAIETPTQIRDVKFSFGELEGIKHEVTTLRAQGIPDADLIYQTAPDHESNRIVITVSKPSEQLFKELAGRYGTAAIALEINAEGPGGSTASRQNDYPPYFGGAKIFGVDANSTCSDSFSWIIGSHGGNALLTAAHCAHIGGPIKINGQTVGSVAVSTEENWNQTTGTAYYLGQSVYRGDVALIRLNGGLSSDNWIYRGGPNSSTASEVVSVQRRYSLLDDYYYLGGQKTGETGPYVVKAVGIDWWYSDSGPNVWVRNVTRAVTPSEPCMDLGDSGGSLFATVTGGVKAAGTLSGYAVWKCQILFTDIYRSYLGLPGDVLH